MNIQASMIRKLVVLGMMVSLSSAFCYRAAAQEVKLFPVDEAAKDASFKRFRDRLIVALKGRDRKFLLSIIHPNILNTYGGNSGIKGFVELWKLNSADSKVWTELMTVLSLGGSFNTENGQKIFAAPYISSRWDSIENKLPSGADAFTYWAIIEAKVPVYSQPHATAPPVVFLSYDVVEVDHDRSVWKEDQEKLNWIKIKTLKGQKGFVQGDKIRSAGDQRAFFKKIRGRWVMYIFIAGD